MWKCWWLKWHWKSVSISPCWPPSWAVRWGRCCLAQSLSGPRWRRFLPQPPHHRFCTWRRCWRCVVCDIDNRWDDTDNNEADCEHTKVSQEEVIHQERSMRGWRPCPQWRWGGWGSGLAGRGAGGPPAGSSSCAASSLFQTLLSDTQSHRCPARNLHYGFASHSDPGQARVAPCRRKIIKKRIKWGQNEDTKPIKDKLVGDRWEREREHEEEAGR